MMVAYVPGARGCVAAEIESGAAAAFLVSRLSQQTQGVEIMTVHGADAYGEYAPYEVVPMDEFISRVILSHGRESLRDRVRTAAELEAAMDTIRRVVHGFGVSEAEAIRVLQYK